MKAIIYTRFSPRRNADTSESCETQEAICREHAEKQGWPVGSVHADKDMSGSDASRPGLAAAIAALRRGDVLLVYNRDRLARSVLIAELTKQQVSMAGATIVAVSGDIAGDDNDPTVVLVRQVLEAVAEHARKQIAARTRDAMLQHQRNGRRMGRFAPYGYKVDPLDPSRLEAVPVEQVAVEEIRSLHAGGMSISEIRLVLDEAMPEAARAGKWRYNTIKNIIERSEIEIKK